MSYLEKFEALVIDPVVESRMRLRSVMAVLPQFKSVQMVNSCSNGLNKVEASETIDVIFLSSDIATADISTCIANCRAKKAAQDAAAVLVVKVSDQDRSTVATNVFSGTDGFLFEPYSVEQLTEITSLAARVRAERSLARQKSALKLALSDIVPNLDKVARALQALGVARRSFVNFKESCQVLRTLKSDQLALYYEIACEVFGEARPPYDPLEGAETKTASRILIKRNAEKMLAKIKEEEESDASSASSTDAIAIKRKK